MISATMAVALALATVSPTAGEARSLDRHVCLMDHGCDRIAIFCLVDLRGSECRTAARICLLTSCPPARAPASSR
ncbi:MAG: hypothetical protein M3323_05605 [Actinomycetota bacterium]|nr:hypothetical protein [Actinomycetota bacterium]